MRQQLLERDRAQRRVDGGEEVTDRVAEGEPLLLDERQDGRGGEVFRDRSDREAGRRRQGLARVAVAQAVCLVEHDRVPDDEASGRR